MYVSDLRSDIGILRQSYHAAGSEDVEDRPDDSKHRLRQAPLILSRRTKPPTGSLICLAAASGKHALVGIRPDEGHPWMLASATAVTLDRKLFSCPSYYL